MFDLVLQEPEGVSKAQNLSFECERATGKERVTRQIELLFIDFEVFCLRWNKIIDIAYCTKAVNNEVALKKTTKLY